MLLVFYFTVPAVLLRWSLDRLVFRQSSDQTHEDKMFEIAVAPGTTIVVRRYGSAGRSCVFFFPGQHGGIGTYERTLFPSIVNSNIDVYAISYPGQDGAKGRSDINLWPEQVASAISRVSDATLCKASRSVFIGRSLGATVALSEASRFKPMGVLVDGLGMDLTNVIRTWIGRHPLLIGWELLPIHGLVGQKDYPAQLLIEQIPSVPISVFQGTADEVTPFISAQNVTRGHPNVTFIPVDGGLHENTYLLAHQAYIESLRSMLHADAEH